MKAILLVSHGSQSPRTKQEVSLLVDHLRQSLPEKIFEFAFLEVAGPSIPEGIDQCVEKGASQVVLCLNFLNSGRHVNEDIPAIVQAAQQKYPKIGFSITKPVGQHAQMPDLFIDMINNA